jgi:hypothetical protein
MGTGKQNRTTTAGSSDDQRLSVSPTALELKECLLKIAGDSAKIPVGDPDLRKIHRYGSLLEGQVVRCGGIPQHCHANSAELWLRNGGGVYICTGYALAGRTWFQHSWCRTRTKSFEWLLLETTPVAWTRYYGVSLDLRQSRQFVARNLPFDRLYRVRADCPLMAQRLGLRGLSVQSDWEPVA